MDPKQHDQDRMFIEVVVTDMARRAMQIRPRRRYDFIMSEIGKISLAYDEKHGPHPNTSDLNRKLQDWAKTFVKILEEPNGTSGHA